MNKKKIFIADDHEIVRYAYKKLLEQDPLFAVVGEAADGFTGLCRAKELKPDILILDISMPVMNGPEVAKAVRAEFPYMKIIVVSVHSSLQQVKSAIQAGVNGFVHKDDVVKELITAIRKVLNGESYISSSIPHDIKRRLKEKQDTPLEALSRQEQKVIKLFAEGKTSEQISKMLGVKRNTINTYKWRAMTKLELDSNQALVRFACHYGLVVENS